MPDITFTIPADKAIKAKEGYLKLYPNSEMTDDEIPVPVYTDIEWVAENTRRLFIRDVHRGLNMIAKQDSVVATDEGMAT